MLGHLGETEGIKEKVRTEHMFEPLGPVPNYLDPSGLEVSGAAATEIVTLWGDTVLSVNHYPHKATFGNEKHISTRGESAIAGACMVGGAVVFGPALGHLFRKVYNPQILPKGATFSLGEDPSSNVWITSNLLSGTTQFALVDTDQNCSKVNLLTGMTGEVTLKDGSSHDLWALAGGGGGENTFELPTGARARVRLGDFTFMINSVLPGRLPAASAEPDWSTITFTGFSFLFHAVFLALIYLIPPDPRSLSLDMLAEDNRFVRYAMIPPTITEPDMQEEWIAERPTDEEQGGQGRRHADDEGAMGRQDSKRTNNRFGIKGPRDNDNPVMARPTEEDACRSGILAVLRENAPVSPFGAETAMGNDPESALGALMGSQIGSNFGYNGLGLRGTGRGGGGDGRGTIGLGRLNTIGHGGGGGTNNGYGRGNGNLRSRQTKGPSVSIGGTTSIRGALSKAVIRRHIRRQINAIRFCYEQQLTRRPDLAGRVQVQFVISDSGAVSSSRVTSSSLGDAATEQCVARAVRRIAFPQPEGGGVVIVTYPFLFQAAER